MYYTERRITTSREQYNLLVNQGELVSVNIYIFEPQNTLRNIQKSIMEIST